MLYLFLTFCFASTGTALKLNTPVSDLLETWNQSAMQLFGPYWTRHDSAKHTVMLRELLSSNSAHNLVLARKINLLQNEKINRARRFKETGVEVIPGCGEGEPCTSKSYYEAVLLESGNHPTPAPGGGEAAPPPGDDDCCDVLWGDCLQASLSSCMKLDWNAETDMNKMDVGMIQVWNIGQQNAFREFVAVPSGAEYVHAHSLLESSVRHHGECAVKACQWCQNHNYKAYHTENLKLLQQAIAPDKLDQICGADPTLYTPEGR